MAGFTENHSVGGDQMASFGETKKIERHFFFQNHAMRAYQAGDG
tara:strand:- start:441 stop:572 length:132 start_codon:yes stop_codon:yes gene_type:complete